MDWSYTVRESPRARRVILKVSAGKGVEVVVPRGFNRGKIPGIIMERREWIAGAIERVKDREPPSGPAAPLLPQSIGFPSVDGFVTVRYTAAEGARLRLLTRDDSGIELIGATDDLAGCRSLLHLWLRDQGRRRLIPWIETIAAQTGLSFKRVQIRSQRSRWGSCSSRGTISLNQKLLFLPAELVRYIFIHELCHTVHLNHSSGFWSLVARFEPDWETLDAEMNGAGKYVPPWAH